MITALLYGYDRGGWWRVLLIPATANEFYWAYRVPRAVCARRAMQLTP